MEQRAEALRGQVFVVQGSRGSANGFVVESGIVVTVAHILGNETGVVLWDASGLRLTGTVLGRDEVADLAVVQVNAMAEPPPFSQELPPQQAPLAVVGYRPGVVPTLALATGLVSSTGIQREGLLYMFVVSVPAVPPDLAGAPVMDAQGRIVGIYTGTVAGQTQPGAVLALSSALSSLPALKAGAARLLPKGCTQAPAGGPPPLPSLFLGRVLLDGAPAPAGTEVYARVVLGSEECWTQATTVGEDGRYSLGVGAPSLGWRGARVEFFVNGWLSPTTGVFLPDERQVLDIQAPSTP